jgi:hypothetical protein
MLSSSIHFDEMLEQALRQSVADIFKTGNLSELTVKRVRLATENALGLEEGFFKGDANWKAKSDRIIKKEAEEKINAQEGKEQKAKEDSPAAPIQPKQPDRRKTPEDSPGTSKRQKTTALSSSESIGELSSDKDQCDKPVKNSAKRSRISPQKESKPGITEDHLSTESDVGDRSSVTRVAPKQSGPDKGASANEQSDSLVEDPKPTGKRQKATQKKTTKRKTKGATTKQDLSVDPVQEEIKRLQGWLVKCGIRKMWSRELAPYGTSKDKIKHLKEMLKDAGMDGRYSFLINPACPQWRMRRTRVPRRLWRESSHANPSSRTVSREWLN